MLNKLNSLLDTINRIVLFWLLVLIIYIPIMLANLGFSLFDMADVWDVLVGAYASIMTVKYLKRLFK